MDHYLDDVASVGQQGVRVEVDVGFNADVLVVAATAAVLYLWITGVSPPLAMRIQWRVTGQPEVPTRPDMELVGVKG